MSLLEKASLVITPNATKEGKLYSVIPNAPLGDLDVVRATTATRVNSAGLIESVANNIPRLDYTNGSCPSILVEPQRTNLLTYSEQFDNAAWGKFLTTITPNTVISPSGVQNADTFETSTNSSGVLFIDSFVSIGDKTLSIYAKKGNNDIIDIGFFDVTEFTARFNLTSGTLVSQTTGLNSTIESVDNDWYRLAITKNITSVGGVFIINSTPLINKTIYIWGAQLEAGSNATSYIPTVATTVTRNADLISKTGISDLIGQTEGTIYAEVDLRNVILATRGILEIRTSGTQTIALICFSNGNLGGYIINSTDQFVRSITTVAGTYKLALAYSASSTALYINGVLVGAQSTSVNIPPSNAIQLGNYGGTADQLNDRIRAAAIFKTRLTNEQLIQLTTL